MIAGIHLRWPVDSRRINQAFNRNPQFYRPFGLPGHEGLDLFAPTNANIYAAASGRVYQASHPADHPYGLHVRIVHEANGRLFRTIYAHLTQVFVQVGQQVSVGERIGLANNTGNSFGSHLHFTLKIDGEQTPGYPAGIVDPLPYLQATAEPPPPSPPIEPPTEPLPPLSELVLHTTVQLNLRAQATTGSAVLALLAVDEAVTVLGDAAAARAKLGEAGAWVQVQTANGVTGFVSAQFVQEKDATEPASELIVYPNFSLRLRSAADLNSAVLGLVTEGEALAALGNRAEVEQQVGLPTAWIQVRTSAGQVGYVIGSGVRLTGEIGPEAGFSVFSLFFLNVRARAEPTAHRITVVAPTDELTVLGDEAEARASVGQAGAWLNVRTPSGHIGYVAANFVQLGGAPRTIMPTMRLHLLANGSLHAQPSFNSPLRETLLAGAILRVVEADLTAVSTRIGQPAQWIHAENSAGLRGWVQANMVEASDG